MINGTKVAKNRQKLNYKAFKLSKFKFLEIQFLTFKEWSYFDLQVKWDRKCDHAGFKLNIHILGAQFYFSIYDSRHWDYVKDRWCEQNQEKSFVYF